MMQLLCIDSESVALSRDLTQDGSSLCRDMHT